MTRAQDAGGPFGGAPDPEVFFPGAGREEACQTFILDILNGRRFLHLGGEAGSGKTLLCQVIMSRLPGDITPVYLDDPAGSFDDLLRHACVDLGAARSGGDGDFTWAGEFDRRLAARQTEGNQVLLIIDQAERLFAATLERLLARVRKADLPPFAVLLAGDAGLDAPLAQLAALGPDYTPDSARTLSPLDQEATEKYLRYRMHTAGIGWNELDAMLGSKPVARIFREARGNIAATNAAAAEILGLGGAAARVEAPERQLPLWGEGGEARRTVLSPREQELVVAETETVIEQAEAVIVDAPAEVEPVAAEAMEAAESVIVGEEAKPADTALAFERIAAQASEFAEPEAAEATEAFQDDETDEDDEEEEDEGRRLWEGIAEKLDSLEERIAPPVIALYDKLWGDRTLLGSALGLALFFCILGLSLGTKDQPAPPVETPAAARTPEASGDKHTAAGEQPATPAAQPAQANADGPTLLRERLAAGRSLVAASYRGAHTVQVLSLSGDRAERELAELLATPPFRREAERLYAVRKPGSPPAFFLFYGIFDDAEQARQARNSMGFELRAHHPYPLPVGEALRLNEG